MSNPAEQYDPTFPYGPPTPGEVECCERCAKARGRHPEWTPEQISGLHALWHRDHPWVPAAHRRFA